MTDTVEYERELEGSFDKVVKEADALYEGRGRLHKTYARLSERLDGIGVAYALIGGYSLILHGVRRFTEDIDLLLTEDGLTTLREALLGRGYVPVQGAERSIRDEETGVRIDIVIAGGYPGDGKPKPVVFPNPEEHLDGNCDVKVVDLRTLIELKLASGMTARGRLQDLADVQRLIEVHALDSSFADKLDPYVRERFLDLL